MKVFKVGLVGFGFIGKVHAKAYHSIPYCFRNSPVSAQVTAILRPHPDKDRDLLSSFSIPMCTENEETFWQQDFDLIDICSPNSMHYEQAQMAIERKIPIYCEKPLTKDIDNARKLAKSASSAGIPTHTAFTYRYYRGVQIAKDILSSDRLGSINHFRAQFFHSSYLDPERPTSWRLQKAISGGGALTDLGIHFLDMIQYLLGDAAWIQCQTRTFIPTRPTSRGSTERLPVDVDDWALCTLGMENGGIGTLEVSRVSGGDPNRSFIEIYGSRGSLKVDLEQGNQVQLFDAKRNSWEILSALPVDISAHAYNPSLFPPSKQSLGVFMDGHIAAIMDCLHRLHEGKSSPANFNEALKAQELLHSAYTSAAQSGIKIPIQG